MSKKSKNLSQTILIAGLSIFLCLIPLTLIAYKASDYNWIPPFSYANEIPSVTIILDSSSSMHRMAYARIIDEHTPGYLSYTKTYGTAYNSSIIYYGYFDNNIKYTYNDSGYFEQNDTDGEWDGNFMNWATMHRIDAMRLALTGGNYTTNSTGTFFEIIATNRLKTNTGATYSYEDFRNATYVVDASKPKVLPNIYTNRINTDKTINLAQNPDTIDLYIYNSTNNPRDPDSWKGSSKPTPLNEKPLKLRIKTEKIENGIFDEYKEEGGKVKARFALFRYYPAKEGTEQNEHGGAKILAYMSGSNSNIEKIKYEINTLMPSGAAPLAEALYTSIGYIKQFDSLDAKNGPRYADDAFTKSVNQKNDPFYFDDLGMVSCTQQNIILITPGESTFGDQVPVGKTNIIPEINPYPNIANYVGSSSGKYYILDTAQWAYSEDLRPCVTTTEENCLDGFQNTKLFVLAAFGKNDILLQDAAWYGGSKVMKNISGIDHPVSENYFEAESGSNLKTALQAIVAAATRGIMSGTAAAVTSQTRTGEGAAYQALFYPPTNSTDTKRLGPDWSGQIHSFLVDTNGRLREDTIKNGIIDPDDKIIEFNNNLVYRRDVGSSAAVPPLNSIQDIKFLWSSSDWLNDNNLDPSTQRDPDYYTKNNTASMSPRRYILTSVNNTLTDFDNSTLDIKNSNHFSSYLTLFSNTETTGPDDTSRSLASRQINFIRGLDVGNQTYGTYTDTVRSRQFKGKTWRLGDIIYSSPTVVGAPQENYHVLYRDNTYSRFYEKYKTRRQMIYVGANDGMLHAFNGGFYNNSTTGFTTSVSPTDTDAPLGMELWAYVPFNLLPHLRWLMDPAYGEKLHVPYMDLKPRIFDARIFFESDGVTPKDNNIYPDGWGTVLVAGMRFGGGFIEMNTDKAGGYDASASSAYVIMDITNPEAPPKLLGEIKMPELGFTTCYPTVLPMSTANTSSNEDNNWYLVFGSGPADETGKALAASDLSKPDRRSPATSAQNGKLYILDLKLLSIDGTIKTIGTGPSQNAIFASTEENSFISDPVAIDVDYGSRDNSTEFKADILYYGTASGLDVTDQNGTMRRFITRNNQSTNSWLLSDSILMRTERPITSAPNLAMDNNKNLWVYFGAGRFFNREDIPQKSRMLFVGVKDPIYNGTDSSIASPYLTPEVPVNSLYDSTNVELSSTYGPVTVHKADGTNSTWQDFSEEIENYPGWRFHFTNNTNPLERVLGQAAIFGGAVLFTSYIPSTDICKAEGSSRLYGLYYKTGTAYPEPIFGKTFDKYTDLGDGVAITPSIHVGEKGPTAYIQTSTGAIKTIEIVPPINVKPGVLFWRKNTN